MAIYPVREDTLLVKRNLQKQQLEGKKFLEIGTGNGEISLTAAKKQAKVTATDINPEAVKHTRKRFKQSNLDGKFFESDLFQKVEGKYDLIVFNPPYLKGEKGIGDEEMWRGGETGLEIVEKFLDTAVDYLSDGGTVWVVLSSKTDFGRMVNQYNLTEIDSVKVWFEEIHLFKLE